MVLLFLLFFAGSAGGQEEFLHKTPSTELEKLFTHGPFDYEVRLNFNIDSQDSHNEIRRSVPEVRTDLGTIALAELQKIQEGSRSIRSSVGPSFGQATYDFLVPAGKHENSSILAILKFSTPDISPVNFTIAMDRLHWFRIGEVRQGQNGDKINYEIQILHAAGVDVRPELTKNSVYKFNIEATQGQTKISSRVRVEVFSFSPTTRRIKTTTEGVTASTEVIEGSGTEPLVLEVEKTTTSTEIGTTTSSQKSTLPTNLSTSTISSAEMDNMSLVTTKTLANNATKSSFLPGSTMFDDQLLSTTIHPKKKGELKRKKPKKPVEEVEGSGEPENSVEKEISTEQDDEDPLSEVVTIATPILQKETIKGIDIDITGVENGVFELKGQLNRGDLLRGLVISAKIKSEDTEWLKLSIDRPEFFSVRPGRVEPGGKAYLFCNHPDLVGDIQLKITISDGPVIEEEIITIRHNKPKEDNSTMKIDFSVSEDASSGAIVGQLKNGNDFKIVGKSGLFALVGDSLVLSCSSEAPCLDYESQHVHYLLLVAKDGSLKTMKVAIQVLDVNDNTPLIEITDAVIRVSDGQLIMPFAVQIEDEDTPAVQQNELSTSGEAANFLELEKVDVDLYQIHVKGSPSPGRYELILRVDDGVHHSRKTHKTVKVLVQNSHSHAHFRRTIYVRNVTPERILPEVEVLRVELEGIPIDEAKFVILNGNPGWLTIDDYGGAISFTRPDRKPVTGKYETAIAALNRETGKILAQTTLSITVLGIAEERKVFMKSVYEKTVDRETSEGVFISLGTSSPFEVEASSLLGIDENGLRKELTSEAISIRGDKVSLSKEAIATLRVIRMVVVSGKEKATVIFHLTSSNSYLEHRRKMASRPLLPALPEILEVAEELPNGHVIMTLPAVHPLTGKVLPIKLEADERDGSFTLDSATGALKVARRMDYDDPATPKKIELKVIAGEEGYETTAKMRMKLVDVDDNPPVIMREGLTGKIVIPENLPIDTVILRVPVSDIDETSIREGLTSKIQGNSASLFKTMISNGTAIIQVAEELDREKTAQHVIQLIVEDQAGQRDSVSLTVELSDVNDNAPKFTREVYDVQAVENWPAGIILETLRATDRDFDSMKRNRVSYKLENLNSKYFSLDSTTGELHIGQDLMGLAREEPYVLTAVATDAGSPPLNSSVMVRITVSEPKKANLSPLKFLSPPMDYKKAYILELMGPLQPNDKVYQAKARAEGDGRNVKYTMKELFMDESLFNIDEMTGEVMVKKGLEKKGEHIVGMGRLEKLLPKRWRRNRTPPSPNQPQDAVEQLQKVVIVKNLQDMASTMSPNHYRSSIVEQEPPPPSLVATGVLRENRSSLRRRREDTWHGPGQEVPLPFIDCDVAADEVDLPSSPLGTMGSSSVASSLPHLSRTAAELGSRESGYLSALSLSPTSCERLTPKALHRAKIRQTSQETIIAKSEGYPSPPQLPNLDKRKATSQILPTEDSVEQFMKGWVYKTKYVTTVFEARNGALGDLIEDVLDEIQRWLERRRMLVAATELHFSVPEEKRCRKDELKLKTSLLSALVKNNQRILNLRRGKKLAPIQLVESRTEEKIDKENGCIQGVYLKAYGRLLRYSHWETPEWHSPYWKLPAGTTKPRPKQFLWSNESDSIHDTALVALLISANHLHSGVETTRLLRIRYTPSTRSSPYFPEGSPFYYRFRRLKSLGTIQAGIEDNGEIFYYLIPSCSPQTSFFSLNATTGELFHSGPESPKMTRVELCVLASNEALSETASLSFNRIRKDNVIIQIVTEHDDETFEPEMGSINNTVITLDDRKMSRSKIVVGEDELSSFYNFSITSVTFLPSETVLPLSTAAPLPSLFSVGPRGIVRPSPTLSTQPSGIYIVKVEAQDSSGDKEDLTQEFHLIAKTSRLRFIVEKPLIPMAKEFPAFEKELKKTLQLSGEKVLRLVLDQPKMVAGNASRSSICFHAVGNDSLLSPQTAIVFLGKIGELFQVYNNFGVIDIAISCIEPTIVEEPISEVLTSPTSLFIISVLAFSILFFFLIFVYFCFIQRYRDYLIGKQKAMQGPPQAVVPSTPTFVLTPPMAHIQPPLGYWE